MKLSIPLEDQTLLNDYFSLLWKGDNKEAEEEITRILNKYHSRGFDTSDYALELLMYHYFEKKDFVLYLRKN